VASATRQCYEGADNKRR